MDEARIERIAKAMCRAARKDPYAPLQQQLLGKDDAFSKASQL